MGNRAANYANGANVRVFGVIGGYFFPRNPRLKNLAEKTRMYKYVVQEAQKNRLFCASCAFCGFFPLRSFRAQSYPELDCPV